MTEDLNDLMGWLQGHQQVFSMLCVLLLIVGAWIVNWIVRHILLRGLHRLLRSAVIGDAVRQRRGAARLASIVPALLIAYGITWIPDLPPALVTVVQNVAHAFIVLSIGLAIGSVLNVFNDIWQQRPDAHMRPIKGYVQVVKIVIYLIATILMVATLIDRSPLILLSGIGAMAAVLMLIFQDTLLSLVASVQITSNDIIRVGDWVEMPQLNADGFVIDIALHTVKVQNWDKTITTVPTKRFISDSFKNWRGMFESGGRRIKRSIFIDQNSVHFLTPEELGHLQQFSLLDDYLKKKQDELDEWNRALGEKGRKPINTRRVTNIGTFRAYVEQYLKNHPRVHQEMLMVVRQQNLSAEGIPLEIWCFSNTTVFVEYEAIQSDIFDHLLAILPEFGLRVFQNPSGADLKSLRQTPTEGL
ncbi:mechanosensitive ion channel family protein [Methylobacillus gramineus]|uniref:mechanosensitive ion channel family protein n=1 Tax=Methylobacillus gramineus TaxID=755169 RepID=UPI001CFFD870|nr:mechanosensitive ion channel family protein [Methylobacillus gramineus]MCB5185695.1 mechanosensitive ion channel family protein [Methylobacillus gramineus]